MKKHLTLSVSTLTKCVIAVTVLSILPLFPEEENLRGRQLQNILDPKASVVKKEFEFAKTFKYLTFGTSQTWGSHLEDRFASAYPYLLSPSTRNEGLRATGARYPALCLQSLMHGDETIYDVVVLEYPIAHSANYKHQDMGYLAQRIRERYPDAIIVIVTFWSPSSIKVDDVFMLSWAVNNGLAHGTSEFYKTLDKQPSESVKYWDGYSDDRYTIAKEVGALVYELPRPDDAKEGMTKFGRLFVNDYHHLSPEGHIHITNNIQELVQKAILSHNVLGPEPSQKKRLGSYGQGDHCANWLTDPTELDTSLVTSTEPQNLIVPVPFVKAISNQKLNEKFSIEIGEEGGSIVVRNQFNGTRLLVVGYMMLTSTPCDYPEDVRVTILTSHGESQEMELHQNSLDIDFHLAVSQKVGIVSEGNNTVTFLPLEKGKLPFRIVSIAVVPQFDQIDTLDYTGF